MRFRVKALQRKSLLPIPIPPAPHMPHYEERHCTQNK